MKILVEGEYYPLRKLEQIIDSKFYTIKGELGVIDYVGYYYSFINKEIIYLLPKVFIDRNKKVLFDFNKDDLIDLNFNEQNIHQDKIVKLKYLLILFYRSLIEYKKRNFDTLLLKKNNALVLNSSLGKDEYSYLDIILNIVNFHKKNKNIILFIEKKNKSKEHKKVSWEKTIKSTLPLLDKNNKPIYLQAYNKKKYAYNEEMLLSIFYSVLYNINKEYKFNIKIDKVYTIYKAKAYKKLCNQAPKILKKIKYKYFSNILVKIYKLMELYFKKTNQANSNKKSNEFILVDNYHIIFEDMVDKLFSDELHGKSKKLKDQKDGKIVDHIFEYESLLDKEDSIFYIGDSKYYKIGNAIEEKSIYKQFTYVKNVIQFNIDLLNEKKELDGNLRYRDDLTEGYNISPNFFIQGKVYDTLNFNEDNLQLDNKNQEPQKSLHFKDRLFDRDTLFVHNYNINFLYVLKSYTQFNSIDMKEFRKLSQIKFKASLVSYLNKNYFFYKKVFKNINDITNYVNTNFRKFNGRMYRVQSKPFELIFATIKENNNDNYIFDNLEKFILK